MFQIHDNRGFSLLELMLAGTILLLVLSAIYNIFPAQERAYEVQEKMAEMNQNARISMQSIVRYIRNAAYDPTRLADAGIQTATAQSIVFTQDDDGDGFINSPREWIGFSYDGTDRQIDQCSGSTNCTNPQPFVDEIQNLQFNYIYADGESSAVVGMPDDGDEDGTNDFDDIREVEIQIVARGSSGFGGQYPSRTLNSRVQVRNLAIQ